LSHTEGLVTAWGLGNTLDPPDPLRLPTLLDAHRVMYRDYGGWYELDVGAEGMCAAFCPLDARDEADALATLRARYDEEWERLSAMAADFPRPAQAEILPFVRPALPGAVVGGDGLPDPSDAVIVAMTIARGQELMKAWLGLSKPGGSSDCDG